MTKLTDSNAEGIGKVVNAIAPKINLSSQEHVRYELCRVYREAKAGQLPTDVATKLAYILIGINKMLEAEAAKSNGPITIVSQDTILCGIDLSQLDVDQLTALEIAVNTIQSIRDGRPVPLEILTKEQYAIVLKEALNSI